MMMKSKRRNQPLINSTNCLSEKWRNFAERWKKCRIDPRMRNATVKKVDASSKPEKKCGVRDSRNYRLQQSTQF